MAIAFVQEVAAAGSSSNATTWILTVGVTTTVGNHLILTSMAGFGLSSVVDSKGNTWQTDSTVGAVNISSCKITTALVSGDTITLTFAGSSGRCASVAEYSGLVSTGWLDKTAGGSGTGTASDSGATATTAQAAELLVTVNGKNGSHTVFTPEVVSPVWNANTGTNSSGQVRYLRPYYRVVSSTGAYSGKATWSPSRTWGQPIATYKAAAATLARSQVVVV